MVRTAHIIYTSDIHGSVMPTDYRTLGELPVGLMCLSGSFGKDENTLLLDCGDMLQGSPFASMAAMEFRESIVNTPYREAGETKEIRKAAKTGEAMEHNAAMDIRRASGNREAEEDIADIGSPEGAEGSGGEGNLEVAVDREDTRNRESKKNTEDARVPEAIKNTTAIKNGAIHPMARILNDCGYDAVTIGNHDFNGGIDVLGAYLGSLDAVCLCANIRDKAGRLPVEDYRIFTLGNGLKIGVTGICTDHVRFWEERHIVERLEILPPLEAAGRALGELKGNCDITVCLYHGGVERELGTGKLQSETGENVGWAIARDLSFDLLLTGHQHREIKGQELFGTWIMQPGSRGGCFGRADICVDEESAVSITSELFNGRLPLKKPVPCWLSELEERTLAWISETAAVLDRRLEGGNPLYLAFNGSGVAELINQAQLNKSGAQISATCLDHYELSIERKVSRRDVLAVYSFANTLVKLIITGRQLKLYLERIAAYFRREGDKLYTSDEFLYPKASHYNYDYIAGAEYTFDLSKPVGERVISLTRNGKDIEDGSRFTICINSYRLSGVAGYEVLRECPVVWESAAEVSQLVLEYLMEEKNVTVNCPCGISIKDKEKWTLVLPEARKA